MVLGARPGERITRARLPSDPIARRDGALRFEGPREGRRGGAIENALPAPWRGPVDQLWVFIFSREIGERVRRASGSRRAAAIL